MKHTVIAGVLFALLLAAVVINGIFVRGVTDELCLLLGELPETERVFSASGKDGAFAFASLWRERRSSLSYSIHEDELDRIDDAVAGLCGAAESGDYENYCAARERLLTFLPSLANGEKLFA